MYHVVHLIHVFLCRNEKGLWNFVSDRIKLVDRIITYYSFQKIYIRCLSNFQTSKTTICRLHTSELKSISKNQLLFHWNNFEKCMIFYTLPCSRWNRTHKLWNTCVVSFAILAHTKIWTLKQLHHCTQCLNHEDISMLCF